MPTRARRNPAVAAARRSSRATVRDRGNRAVPRRREPILTLQYWREGRWYVGELVEAPDVFSQGRTLDELRRNMLDAWELMLKERPHPGLRRPR